MHPDVLAALLQRLKAFPRVMHDYQVVYYNPRV